jgi:glycosyltransferase involved in cell wall biosynthesis
VTRISAVVIAKNEEKNIRACLESVAFCDEAVVVDSGSADRTREVAASLGAKVFEKPFVDYASQKNFAVSKASGDWVLLIDADERLPEGAGAEIRRAVEDASVDGWYFLRTNYIFGRRMRHGANRDDRQLRLLRREKAVLEGAVHETVPNVRRAGTLRTALLHHSTATVSQYMGKLNAYTSLEAAVMKGKGRAFSRRAASAAPWAVFFKRYVLERGFLDGIEGYLFAALSGYYEFVRRAKHWELLHAEKN